MKILRLITFFLLALSASASAQVYPADQPQDTTISGSEYVPWQLKSGSNYTTYRLPFVYVKRYMSPNVVSSAISFDPTTATTAQKYNYLGRFVTYTTNSHVYYIDGQGLVIDLGDPAASGGGSSVTSVFGRTGGVTAVSGDYTASQITNTPNGTISAITVQNALNELGTEKLADATDAVDADNIAAGAVGSSELASSGVTAGTYGGATNSAQIVVDADGRITSATNVPISGGGGGGLSDGDYLDIDVASSGTVMTVDTGAITTIKILDDAVTAAKIAAGAVGTSEIATDGVAAAEIAADAVGTSEIATDGVAAAEIAADAVGASEIATGAVTTTEILDGTIAAADLGQMGASSGQVMKWNGSAWAAAADNNSGSSGRDSMYIASPDTLVHKNVYGNIQKLKLVFNLPADSFAIVGSSLYIWRRGSGTPMILALPNPTPAIVSVTASTNTTVTLSSGEVYEVNLSGISTCNVTWAGLTSGKQHKVYFQNGGSTTLNLPTNTIILRDDGGTCLANPIVNKANALIEGYTNSSNFYVTNSSVPLQCVQYNPAYQAVLDYATAQGYTLPSLSNQLYQSRLVDSLQSNAIWDSLDVFYSFYTGTAADSNFTRINWKDPTGDDNISPGGGRTFAALTGWNSNGSSGFLNTNWNPSSEGIRYDLNTCSFGAWITAPGGTGSKYNMGIQVSGGTTRMEENSGGRKFIINASGETTTTGGATSGLWHINRSASNVTAGYLNGSLQTSDTDLSTSVSNGNLYLMGLNLSNAVFGPTVSTVKYRFAFAGGNLASKASAFYTILNAHVSNIN